MSANFQRVGLPEKVTENSRLQRREEILVVALEEFAGHGLHGTSTDTIAERAGVSQPYLFRLFGTKKELYLESVRRCLSQTLEVFQEAAAGKSGEDALEAIGAAYGVLLAGPHPAPGPDAGLRRLRRRGRARGRSGRLLRLVQFAERVSGAGPKRMGTSSPSGCS